MNIWRRQDKGLLLSEEQMETTYGMCPARIAKVRRHCLATGQWEFDQYDSELVLYKVVLEREFSSTRTVLLFVASVPLPIDMMLRKYKTWRNYKLMKQRNYEPGEINI